MRISEIEVKIVKISKTRRPRPSHILRIFLGRDGAGRKRYHSKIVEGTKPEAEKQLLEMLTEVDGELGYGFAAGHHTVPMSESAADHRTRLTDLAIVCANCHRMIHRGRPRPTVQKEHDSRVTFMGTGFPIREADVVVGFDWRSF